MCVGTVERVLPPAAVEEALNARVQAIAEREGRSVRGRERRRLKEDVLVELIPRAFTRRSRVLAYVDVATGTLVVDTGSRRAAERVVSELRRALGSFPATPLKPAQVPRSTLTSWLAGEALPSRWVLGEEATLQAPGQKGATIKARYQELLGEEIGRHLEAGKQVTALGLSHNDRLTFVLGEDLAVKKLKFTEIARAALDDTRIESAEQELDAVFALTSGLVGQLLQDLFATFGVPAPEDATATVSA